MTSVVHVVGGLSGTPICAIRVDPGMDVGDLKWEIQNAAQIPEEEQKLLNSGKVLANEEIVEQLSASDGEELKVTLLRFSPEYAKILTEMRTGRKRLHDVEEVYWSDREVVLTAVQRDGDSLLAAAPELKDDRTIALAAVKQRGQSLQYASQALRCDREVVLAAVRQDGLSIKYASEGLRGDAEIGLAAVHNNGWALEMVAPTLQDNRKIVQAAIVKEGQALKHAAEFLQRDRELVLMAVRSDAETLRMLPSEMRSDDEIVRAASYGVRIRGQGGLKLFQSFLKG